jgi:hypothetical protein
MPAAEGACNQKVSPIWEQFAAIQKNAPARTTTNVRRHAARFPNTRH